MRITGHRESPQGAEDFEVFDRLHQSGPPGRVVVTVTERKLSIEQRKGHCVEIDNDFIMKMDHASKPYLPFGYAFFGALLLWIASRGMVFGTMPQLFTFGFGLFLMGAHFGLRRPSLTIETQSEWYTLHGNDARLMRLAELHRRLARGQSMDQARLGLDELQRDVDFPRSQASQLIPAEPVRLDSPIALTTLLVEHGDQEQIPATVEPLQFLGSTEPIELDLDEPETEGWMFGEPEPLQPEHGFVQRGRANARNRGDALLPRDNLQHTTSQVHHPAYPYPTHQTQDVGRSYGRIAESTPNLPVHHHVAQQTQSPREFLPTWFGPEGAHVPAPSPPSTPDDEFSMFDEDLSIFEEEPDSLIAAARVDSEPMDAELAPDEPPMNRANNPRFVVEKRTPYETGRYTIERTRSKTMSRVGGLINSVTKGVSNSIAEGATLTGKLLAGTPPNNEQARNSTDSGRELRERSSRSHIQEMEDSVANLSQQHGGVLPEEEANRLKQHVSRRHTIVEQLEQEKEILLPEIDLDELSFEELTEVTHTGDGNKASGLSKIDF
jgi:hypothetical protein